MRFRAGGPDLPRAVYWIAILAFGLRLGARICAGTTGFFESGYSFFFDLAQSVATGHGFSLGGIPTAFRVPLYPLFLAALTWGHEAFWPVAIAQSLVGAVTCLCAALLARRMFVGQAGGKAATLAAFIASVYPYYVVHDTALQETGLFTLMTLLAVLSLEQTARTGAFFFAALSGVLLGADVLTRATIMPFAIFAVLWLIWRTRTAVGLLCVLLLALAVFPWLWRSYKLTGSAVLSTETGLQLWTGNNGFLFRHYPKESFDISRQEAVDALTADDQRELDRLSGNEALKDRWFRNRALAYIRSHPRSTIRDGIRKIVAAFGWLPSPRHRWLPNLAHAFSYGPVMLLGIWGMWRRRLHWRDDLLIYGLFATFLPVTAVFFADTSHRSYLDVYWIVFGAGALATVSSNSSDSSSNERRVESSA